MRTRVKALVVSVAAVFGLGFGGATAQAATAIVVGGTFSTDSAYIVNNLEGFDTVKVVDYPASVIHPWYDQSVAIGTDNLRAELANTPGDVTVIGYSQGARIAGDVLAETDRGDVSGILYADPRQSGQGIETQLPFDLPGARMSGERGPFGVPVMSYCAPGDGVCDWRNGDPIGSVVGYFRFHTSYFD